jgi:hypothetical protein
MSTSNDLRNALKEARFPAPIQPIQTVKAALIPVNSELHDYLDLTFDTDAVAALVSQSIETTLASKATTASLTSVSQSIETTLASTNAKLNGFFPFASVTGSCANDAAAQAAGVPVGGLYHTAGAVKVRLT